MKYDFVADESVAGRIISSLRKSGFSILSILETTPSITDDKVLQIAVDLKCMLITEDKDFGELCFRLGKKNYGILLLRLSDVSSAERGGLVVNAIENYKENLYNSFSVLISRKIRITKLNQ